MCALLSKLSDSIEYDNFLFLATLMYFQWQVIHIAIGELHLLLYVSCCICFERIDLTCKVDVKKPLWAGTNCDSKDLKILGTRNS